ncbi:MAG: hypothetical protein AAF493_16330 [Pseudomonadota bacterium]
MRILILLLSAFVTVSVSAQQETLGRLFTSPADRAALDDARAQFDPNRLPEIPTAEPVPEEEPDVPEVLTPTITRVQVGGYVYRSSGNHSSWVNGEQVLPGQVTPEGLRVRPQRRRGMSIVFPNGANLRSIKAGQVVNVTSGQVAEPYQQTSEPTVSDPESEPSESGDNR